MSPPLETAAAARCVHRGARRGSCPGRPASGRGRASPAAEAGPPRLDGQRPAALELIVHGSVVARDGAYPEALRLSQEHVARSRQEPGCLRHAVLADLENPDRLVFVEHWASAEDLLRHFKLPASVAFARAVTAVAASAPDMKIHEATEFRFPRR